MRTNHRTAPALATGLVAAGVALAALGAAILLLNPPKTEAAGTAGTVVSTASTGLGRILVNSGGHTLYLFGKDKNGKSACAGKCATFWPPLIASSKPRVAGVAKSSLLGTTKRADGRLQVTYNRHPLYTFVKDKQKGQTSGEGVTAFGGRWNAISAAGAKVERPATPKPVQSGIPQNNGGDGDSDNNGGPSDGDGNI